MQLRMELLMSQVGMYVLVAVVQYNCADVVSGALGLSVATSAFSKLIVTTAANM